MKVNLTICHNFIVKTHFENMKYTKIKFIYDTEILLGNLVENYAFVQDRVQMFHLDSHQAILHPFVAYYRDDEVVLQHMKTMFISDTTHNSCLRQFVFEVTLHYIKERFPTVKVYYFTDGCGGQHKNWYIQFYQPLLL